MSDLPQSLIERLRQIDGYDTASKTSYSLLFESMEDIDAEKSKALKKIAPQIKKIRSHKILTNTGNDNRDNTIRILKSLLKNSPFEEKIDQVSTMKAEDRDDCFVIVVEYWIRELHKIQ